MATVSPKKIAEAIYEATKGKVAGELDRTIKRSAEVVRDKRMLGKSDEILHMLQNIIEKKAGTIRMKVTSAKRLHEDEKKKLESEIKEKYKAQTVISEFFEKVELLGGMKVEVGDDVLDATYQNKLRKLEKFLIHE